MLISYEIGKMFSAHQEKVNCYEIWFMIMKYTFITSLLLNLREFIEPFVKSRGKELKNYIDLLYIEILTE